MKISMTWLPVGIAFIFSTIGDAAPVQGWVDWRGPQQNGTSLEKGLPDKIDGKKALWTSDLPGQSTPVIANGKLYINGFAGDGPDLQEIIACFDAETGKLLWQYSYNDFLSDTIYLRYSTSSPTIDPETGNVYMQGTQGILACFTADGKWLWEHSLMEEYGRMTFPNSRTASPIIDKDLVITRGITSNWGAQGTPGDRFYAFDKKTGELVWSSTPGARPQDNTFSHPRLDWWNGKRVLYSAAGDCSLVALNARTGEPIWRVSTAKSGAKGGVNAAVLTYGDTIITVHESENLDSSEIGRMTSFRIPQSVTQTNPNEPAVFTPKELEVWRNSIGSLASSPVLVGDTVYEMSGTGDLCAVNANNGKLYIQTDRKLYCFGKAGKNPGLPANPEEKPWPKAGPVAKLQAIPSEVLLRPSDNTSFRIRGLDANGLIAQESVDPKSVKWASYIPPTALVKSAMKGSFNANGELAADAENAPSAGAFMA